MPKSYAGEDWGTSDDIDEFRRSFAAFCERVAQLSNENPPPGANAANGWFRKAMLEDQQLTSLIPPRGQADDPEASAIFQIMSTFEQGIRGGFSPENYDSSWIKSGRLAIKALDTLKSEIGAVIASIASIASLNAASIAAIAKSVDELVDKINKSGIKYEGAHANGWIQKNIEGTAAAAKAAIAPYVTGAKDPNAKKLAEVIDKVSEQIVAIENFENKPWLYGEWQVLFQAIMATAAATLYELKRIDPTPPAEQTQPAQVG